MRTSIWDIVCLAYWLMCYPRKSRRHLRIGQIIGNAVGDPYYVENDTLIREIADNT
jgi:hypothetical protein